MNSPSEPLSIGILITNYNAWHLVEQCVNQNLKYSGDSIKKIVVVDDCSTIPNPVSFDKRVQIIQNETNLGFSKSINVGFRNLDTDIIMLFDSDAYPLHDYVPAVRKRFEESPDLGLIGFKNVDENHNPTGSYEPEPSVWNLILGQKLDHIAQRLYADLSIICPFSCSLAIRRECLLEIGGFDENFQQTDVDLDFCMRVHRSRWRLTHAPEIIAFHKGGSFLKSNSKRVLQYYKSRWYLLQKYDKIKNAGMVKSMILTRLYSEYIFLACFGKLVFRQTDIYQDKLNGRSQLIKHYLKL